MLPSTASGDIPTAGKTSQQPNLQWQNMSPAYWQQQQQDIANFYKSIGTTPQQFSQQLQSLPPDQQKALQTQVLQAQNAYFNPDNSLTKAMGIIAPALAIGAATWGIGGTLAGPAAGASGLGGAGGGLYDTGGLLADAGSAGGISDVGYIGAAGSGTGSGLGVDLAALNAAPSVGALSVAPSSYMPSALVSAGLQNSGWSPLLANAAGGAVQGAGVSALTGGNPLLGAIGGGVGSGVGTGVQSLGAGSAVNNAVGGGWLGNSLGSATNAALSGGITSAIMGGNPLASAAAGAAGAGVGSALGGAASSVSGSSALGNMVGNVAGQATGSAVGQSFAPTSSQSMGSLGSGFNAPTPSAANPNSFNAGTAMATTAGLAGSGFLTGGAASPASSSGGLDWGSLLNNLGTLYGGYSGYQNAKNPMTTATVTPTLPQWQTDAYQNILKTAAQNPYTPYTGQLTAGMNADQTNAANMVRNNAGLGADQQAQVNSNAANLSQGVNPASVNQWMNPYQQNVIDSTMAQLNQQRQLAQQGVNNQAEAAKAFGGDRQAVQAGVTNGQYDLNTASTLANLNSANYGQALGQANTNFQNMTQGNNQLQSAINAQRANAQTDASNLMTSGGIQQANAQNALTANYNEALRQQAGSQQSLVNQMNAVAQIKPLTTQQYYGPQQSPLTGFLNGITGASTMLNGQNGAGSALSSAAGGIGKLLSGLFGGSSPAYSPTSGASLGLTFDPTSGQVVSNPSAGFGSSSPWSSIGQGLGSGTGLFNYGTSSGGASQVPTYLDPNSGAPLDTSSLFGTPSWLGGV